MWWMMLPLAGVNEPDPIETLPPLARPAALAARQLNENVQAAAEAWLAAVTITPGVPSSATQPKPFMSVETRNGETRVAVGQTLPALPFVTLPRVDVPLPVLPLETFMPWLKR